MTGIERYAACIAEEMLNQDKKNEYLLVFRNEVYPIFNNFINNKRIKAEILTGNNKFLFFQWTLCRALYRIKADKYLFLAFTSPVFFKSKGIFNTIHDMGVWDSAGSLKLPQKFYWKMTYKVAGKISEKIITVSKFSKERIANILHFSTDRISVVPSAVYKGVIDLTKADYSEVKKKYFLPGKYILALSTLEPRKNLGILLKAYVNIMNKVDYDLVLVGRKGWKVDAVLRQYSVQKRIHITGFIKDEHIAHIYKNAMCFIFPSLYEGFGLPPVEALSLGTPVIASDAAAIPEVLRGQAVYFKNNSERELQDILLNLNENVKFMPVDLDDYQKENYRFDVSAGKVLRLILN